MFYVAVALSWRVGKYEYYKGSSVTDVSASYHKPITKWVIRYILSQYIHHPL